MDKKLLAFYSNSIQRACNRELKASGLPKVLKNLPLEYLYGEERFLGLYFAPFLAELAGWVRKREIIDLGVAFIFGRLFVIAQDQIADNPKEDNTKLSQIMLVLYERFVERMERFSNDRSYLKKMHATLQRAAHANLHDKHRGNVVPYTKDDLYAIGARTSIVQIPALAISFLTNKPHLDEKLSRIVYNILVSIQLMDDICDIEYDFKIRYFTAPITHGQLLSRGRMISLDNIYRGLMLTGLFESLLNYALSLLKKTKHLIRNVQPKPTLSEQFISGLIYKILSIRKKVSRIKQALGFTTLPTYNFGKLHALSPALKRKKVPAQLIRILLQLEPKALQAGLINVS